MTKKTRTNLIIAGVVAVVVTALCAYVLISIVGNGEKLREQIDALAAQNDQAASLFRLQRLAQETVTPRAELASYFLLRESDSITFLTEIESLAPKVGLSLETETLQQVKGDGTDWIEVSFKVGGARGDVENFIKILEIIPYVSRIQSVIMGVQGGNVWEATITIQVQLLSYDS